MRAIEIPYSGELLLGHLAAYGLAIALNDAGVPAFVRHSAESLSFEPIVELADDIDDEAIAAAVRSTAAVAESAVEADLVPGKSGNDRRSVIWARGSFANDTSQAGTVVLRRAELVEHASATDGRALLGVLAGLGSPASWGPDTLKPPHGSTTLDGVLGNHTSDIVRGVLRPARAAASALEAAELWATTPTKGPAQLDKTGWAPAGTQAPLAHQWLAVLGLGVLPVAHRPTRRSATPASWSTREPRASGLTLPLFSRATSLARIRVSLGLRALTSVAVQADAGAALVASAELRALGIPEVVMFERLDARGQGSSVAFSFRRGRRVEL